jgi:hypothetical protein
MSEYCRLLEAAGFTQVDLKVTRRYSLADLRAEGSELLSGLSAEAAQALDGRVTSCAITARRPA